MNDGPRVQMALRLPREVGSVGVARRIATSALVDLGVSTDCVDVIRLALSEACTNVVDHASTASYDIELEADADVCEIRVIDHGNGFDAIALATHVPDPEADRGRGLAIMRALMDTTAVTSSRATGTVVTLRKILDVVPGGPLDPS